MALVPDQSLVEELAAATTDPTFHDGVCAGCPDRAAQGSDPGSGEHCVECGGEFRVAIAEQELDAVGGVAVEVHQQVPGHLAYPRVIGMVGDAEDPDPAGCVFDDCQDVGGGAVEEIDGDEVGGQDRFGLGAQELRPRRAGTSRRRRDPSISQDLPHRRRGHGNAESGEFTVDPPVPPCRILLRQPKYQAPGGTAGTRATRSFVLRLSSPATANDVPMPAQHRGRRDDQPSSGSTRTREDVEQDSDQCPVRPRDLRSGVNLSLHDRQLVAQEQNLGGLPGFITMSQTQPFEQFGD